MSWKLMPTYCDMFVEIYKHDNGSRDVKTICTKGWLSSIKQIKVNAWNRRLYHWRLKYDQSMRILWPMEQALKYLLIGLLYETA